MDSNPVKTVVIVGGGHASLPTIKMGKRWKKHQIEIRLISAHPFLIYSGALPQYMAGFYNWNQTAVNLEMLCKRYSVSFAVDRVISVNREQKNVETLSGEKIHYDVLLLNVGASTQPILDGDNVSPVKPMPKLLELRKNLLNGEINRLLIAGGGAAGAEIALNLSHPALNNRSKITLADKNNRILSAFPEKLSADVNAILKDRGVAVLTGYKISDDDSKNYDQIILATGNRAESVSIDHDFEVGESSRILTKKNLLVKEQAYVFAAGDTADVNGKNYKQIGVHAVKQGVVLRHNIKAVILKKSLRNYKPYRANPLIISNGPDSAFYIMNRLSLKGRAFAILKYILDMRWLDKYTRIPENRRSLYQLFKEGLNRSE